MKGGVINARHVAGTRGLVFFGLEGEGVNIDTSNWDVGVALVRLDKVEVRAEAFLEAVVAVELELSTDDGVTASVDGAETSVVRVITGGGDGTEIGGG